MILVVDTNIVFAAMLRESTARALLLDPPFRLYAPDILTYELEKHRSEILRRSGLDAGSFDILLGSLLEHITIAQEIDFIEFVREADILIGKVHTADIPFLALALAMPNANIWSEDKHFEQQDRVKVWKTKDLLELLGLS